MESTSSDTGLLDLLRKHGPQSVAELKAAMRVTATAVRQRLVRLTNSGEIQRQTMRMSRGRPVHRYGLTEKGRLRAGANFGDLAVALWQEVREIKDAEVRRGLLQRLSSRLAAQCQSHVTGTTIAERMESLAELLRKRQIPFDVEMTNELPVLHARACPYPGLAERDRTVCSMERMMFSELLGASVRLSNCRLDGYNGCTFEPSNNIATP